MIAEAREEELWIDHRELALLHNLNAYWSIPILSRRLSSDKEGSRQVLGTFAVYLFLRSA